MIGITHILKREIQEKVETKVIPLILGTKVLTITNRKGTVLI